MYFKLIISIQILYLLNKTSSQYDYRNFVQNSHYQNQYENYYSPEEYVTEEENDYDEPHKHFRRSRPKHYKRRPYGSSGGKFPQSRYNNDDLEECLCTCVRCDDQDPCCNDVCTNCNEQDNLQGGQSSLVIVPYPYPLIVTPKVIERNVTKETPTTTSTTTTTTTTSAPESRKFGRNQESDSESEIKSNYVLASLRRTKPGWLPKYGIVSLPNNLAQKLMSKLRDVKELQNPRT